MFSKHISDYNCQWCLRIPIWAKPLSSCSPCSNFAPLATLSLVPNPYLPSVCWAFCFFRIKLADYPWNICPKGRIEHEKHISQHGDGVEQRMLPVLLSFSIISSNHCSTFQKALRSTLSCVFCDSWLRQTLQMHPRRGVRPASEASSFH